MSTLITSNISDGTDTIGTEYVVNGSAKAHVTINQVAGTELDSLNVSSITDFGVGTFEADFTNTFSTADFPRAMACRIVGFADAGLYNAIWSATSTGLQSWNAGVFTDTDRISTACFGDLA